MGKHRLKAVSKEDPRLVGNGGDTLVLTRTTIRFWKSDTRTLTVARYSDVQSMEVFFGVEPAQYQVQVTGRLLCQEPGCERECSKATLSITLPGWAHWDVVAFLETNSPLRTSESKERAAAESWYASVVAAPGPRGRVTITTNAPVEKMDVLVNSRKYKDLSSLEQLVPSVYAMDLPLGRFVLQVRFLPAKWPAFLKERLRQVPSPSVTIDLTPEDDDIVLHLENQYPIPILRRSERKG